MAIDMLQPSVSTGAIKKAMDSQSMLADVVTKTLDKLNTGTSGGVPVVNQDFSFQKNLLSAAYAERGVGTKLDVTA